MTSPIDALSKIIPLIAKMVDFPKTPADEMSIDGYRELARQAQGIIKSVPSSYFNYEIDGGLKQAMQSESAHNPPDDIEKISMLASELVMRARHSNVVLTIEQKPLYPLAMGNYESIVSTRHARSMDAPGWHRDDEATMLCLMLVSHYVPLEVIAKWTDEQVQQAETWAGAVHYHASDNDDVVVPPKPEFLNGFEDHGTMLSIL